MSVYMLERSLFNTFSPGVLLTLLEVFAWVTHVRKCWRNTYQTLPFCFGNLFTLLEVLIRITHFSLHVFFWPVAMVAVRSPGSGAGLVSWFNVPWIFPRCLLPPNPFLSSPLSRPLAFTPFLPYWLAAHSQFQL